MKLCRSAPLLVIVAAAAFGCADAPTSPSDRIGLTLHVSSARAEMVRGSNGHARIDYTVCYAIGVASMMRRPMTIRRMEFTLIAADGSMYSVTNDSVSGQRIGGGESNRLYGCPVVFEEPDAAAPTATRYRMRVDFTLEIAAAAPHTVSAEGAFATP